MMAPSRFPTANRLRLEKLERRDLLASDLLGSDLTAAASIDVLDTDSSRLAQIIGKYSTQTHGNRISLIAPSSGSLDAKSIPVLQGDMSDPAATGVELLKAVDPGNEYQLVEVKHGLASSHARFEQVAGGIAVHGSSASVHLGPDGAVQTLHIDSYQSPTIAKTLPLGISFGSATAAASSSIGITQSADSASGELVWHPTSNGETVLAWKTTIRSIDPIGDFETIVDADSGKVLATDNLAVFASGTGDVFEPNPYQTKGSGTGLADNNDANSAALDAELISVTLQRLDPGTGLLSGEWVDLSTLNSPTLPDVDANEPTRVYQYTRDDPRFEQVMIYHAIDSIQEYIHTLGFDDDTGIPNGIRDFPTLANAHWFTDDQSFYSTGNDAVHFGDGGVDDGEDADIIAHEYGHAIQHDQNANWGGTEMDAMGEGYSDYLAASFYASDGDATYQSSHDACVGEWDATSYSGTTPPCLRRVDGNKMYPDDLVGQVHADGEIWSAALWNLRAAIGSFTTDQLLLEHHFALPANATMPEAAQAMLTADANLNGGANAAEILQAFSDRGILANPAGSVEFNNAAYAIGDTVTINLSDSDLAGAGTATVVVTSDSGDSESVALTETNAGEFSGSIVISGNTPVLGNGSIEAVAGDQIMVSYNDADDGSGSPAVATDTADVAAFVNLFEADFTDDLGAAFDEGFTLSGPANEWHLSTGRANDSGHSPDDSFYFGSGEGPFGGGSHNNNSDGTLTSPLIDLSTATTAEFSFNHLLDSESGFDFASVSVIQGASTTVLASSQDGSLPFSTNGFESQTLSLSPFIGQTIQLAFRFTSDVSVTNEGWYIDDVIVRGVVPNVQLTEVFVADFSDEQNDPFDEGFTLSGPSNEWHLSTGRGNDPGHTSDDSFYFGSGEGPTGGGTHGNLSDGTITSPLIDLTEATTAFLSFNHWLQSEQNFDFAMVNVIANSTTTLLATTNDLSLPIATSGFESAVFNLSDFAGQEIQIAFQFTSDVSVVNEGWYVDDVVVRADVPEANSFVESVSINGGEAQRSTLTEIAVSFDREVTAPAAAFSVVDRDTLLVVDSLVVNTSVDDGKTVATLTFAPGTSVQTRTIGDHSLLDGKYRLDIDGALITEAGSGTPMGDDYQFGNGDLDNFFRKYGDANGNGLVELFDFAQFRGTYNKAPTDPDFIEPLDNDGNGAINLFDFALFRSGFGS